MVFSGFLFILTHNSLDLIFLGSAEAVRRETEQLFDGKLCQDYSCQNCQNLMIGFHVTVENVGDVLFGT